MKHIVLTGGGTAGHVTPNIALIPRLKELGYQISYIGSYNGIEKKLIEELGIPYYGISSGKLRRYFDLKNFSDPFRVLKGFSQARKILKELKPDVVFSKGGPRVLPINSVSLQHPKSAVIFLRQLQIFLPRRQFSQELQSARNFFPEVPKPDANSVVSQLTNRYLWSSAAVLAQPLSMIMYAKFSLNF